jgi:uncharacterized protein YutE (UPF0331/DUF86 family)
MDNVLLAAKLNQLLHILAETEDWLMVPPDTFSADTKLVRACQRNLQLLVEYASDINGILILELGRKAPGSYRESFTAVFAMPFASEITSSDRDALVASVDWRNDLIHEYEPAESHVRFYQKLKEFFPAFRNYARAVHQQFFSEGATGEAVAA